MTTDYAFFKSIDITETQLLQQLVLPFFFRTDVIVSLHESEHAQQVCADKGVQGNWVNYPQPIVPG